MIEQHSTAYHAPGYVPEGRVLVVGGGNTGFQIAKELSASREVHLSIGSQQKSLRQRILGRDLFSYLGRTALIRSSRDTRIGSRREGRELLIGSSPRALRNRYGVGLHPRAADAAGRAVSFSDGSSLDVAGVIWATRFRHDLSWIDAQVFDADGGVVHRRGVTSSPGLYFLGLTWQHTRGSALIGWVGDDATYIAEQINTFRTTLRVPASTEPAQVR